MVVLYYHYYTMATTLRCITLTKNIVSKKWSYMVGSAWYSSAPGNKKLWEVRYRTDGREDRAYQQDPQRNTTEKDYFLRISLFLQREIDFSFNGFKTWLSNLRKDIAIYKQRYIAARVEILGPELAAAHFVVYRGGAVKFCNNQKWIYARKGNPYDADLPKKFIPGIVVEAIDASGTNLLHDSLVHFEILQRLKWLSFRNNKNVDDWFLDRLAFCKNTLEYLDISGCPNVTERGAMSLHRFRALKVLKLGNLQGVKHAQLLQLLLEEVLPDCKIEGIENELENFSSSELLASEQLQLDQPAKANRAFGT